MTGPPPATDPPLPAPNGDSDRERAARRAPRVGDTIGGYRLVDELASGGMGRVFRAIGADGEAYALKTILKNEGLYRKRFEREVQVGMFLNHPNLVRLVDCDMNYAWPYLVQELLMGVNLRDLYKARRRLPERAVMFIVMQIAQALNAAYRFSIIHRDIKPDNIFMTAGGVCKLLDMGLVKVGGMPRVTESHDLVGTLQFMAPEQLRDATQVDHNADVYSLGATAFLLLTGRLPRRGQSVREVTQAMLSAPRVSPREVYPRISAGADAIVSRMTMLDPTRRYESPAELVSDCETYFERCGLVPRELTGAFLLHELIPQADAEAASADGGEAGATEMPEIAGSGGTSTSRRAAPAGRTANDEPAEASGSSSVSDAYLPPFVPNVSPGSRADVTGVMRLPMLPPRRPRPDDGEIPPSAPSGA